MDASLLHVHRGSHSSFEDMQWNFDTTKETKPIVRPSLETFAGNSNTDAQQVNHISEPPPVATAPIEAGRPIDMETALDDTPVESTQRLSNGFKDHTEEIKTREKSPATQGESSLPLTQLSADNVESNGVDSESNSDEDEVIGDTTEVLPPTGKEGGARHMSAMSISEETRALDEALSRSSVISVEDSTPNLMTEEEVAREDPTQYEHVGGSSSEEDVQPMGIVPETVKPLVRTLSACYYI